MLAFLRVFLVVVLHLAPLSHQALWDVRDVYFPPEPMGRRVQRPEQAPLAAELVFVYRHLRSGKHWQRQEVNALQVACEGVVQVLN